MEGVQWRCRLKLLRLLGHLLDIFKSISVISYGGEKLYYIETTLVNL